jgi:hypothetical protein
LRFDYSLNAVHFSNGQQAIAVFIFFSNRLGCLGSLALTLIGSLILIGLMRACSSASVTW